MPLLLPPAWRRVWFFSLPRFMSFAIYSFHSTVFIKCLLRDIWGHPEITKTKVLPSGDLQSGRKDRQSKRSSAVWQVPDRSSAQGVHLASALLSSYIFTPFPTYTSRTRSTDIYQTFFLHLGPSSNPEVPFPRPIEIPSGPTSNISSQEYVSDFPELIVSTYILP